MGCLLTIARRYLATRQLELILSAQVVCLLKFLVLNSSAIVIVATELMGWKEVRKAVQSADLGRFKDS